AVVALSGVPMVLAALGFAIAPDQRFIFVYAALFGLGYGGVFAVGWALAMDSVPELGDVARDLGIWGTLSNIPMVIAPAIGAAIITGGATVSEGCPGAPGVVFCAVRYPCLRCASRTRHPDEAHLADAGNQLWRAPAL